MPTALADLPRRAAGWLRRQPLFLPLVAAMAITAVLGAIVLAPLVIPAPTATDASLAGGAPGLMAPDPPSPPETPTPQPDATSTPWPRRPRLPSPTAEPTAIQPTNARTSAAPTASSTAEPTATPRPEPTATATPQPRNFLYLANADDGLDAWNGPNWFRDGDLLVNDGGAVTAQPWLIPPDLPAIDGSYAVETEFQVLGVADGYCQQSFGVVVGSAGGGTYLGGGIIFFCDGGDPAARITDVSDWTNGYNADPELSSKRLDPGTDWHTLRLEIAGDRVRLLIDGALVLDAVGPFGDGGTPSLGEFGLWSQGVRVAIRRISVEPLADST